MKKINGKFGAEKILSMYWFLILILVAGGISAMVYLFYHHPYDIREVEANIITNKISECLSEGGKFKWEILENENLRNNFLDICNLNFNVEEGFNNENQYYIQITLYKHNNLKEPVFDISDGNKNLISSCKENEEKEFKKLAACVERDFFSLDKNNVPYLIKILSIVRKTEKNIKT